MLVYGHHAFPLNVPAFLRALSSRLDALPVIPEHDVIVDLLVDFGEAYVAVADALQPTRDDWIEALQPWSDAAHATAAALVASWHHEKACARDAIDTCRAIVRSLIAGAPPRDVSARTAEGFAYYGLLPEQYVVAAERFACERRSSALTCIGVRGIGAPLAHVVAAAASRCGVRSRVFTVRPRGHPFDRRLDLTDRLRRRIVDAHAGCFAVVDEGPGLSGSSFAAVSDALMASGVGGDRIVIFPSWCAPEEALRSPRGRDVIRRHHLVVAPFDDVWRDEGAEDVSAGRWRTRVFGNNSAEWPAVHPQHERRKYLTSGGPAPRLKRFVGLGRYGRAKLARARALAEAGFGPSPLDLARGFLCEEWVAHTAPPAVGRPTRAVVDRIAEYLAFLGRTFATGRPAQVIDLVEMMRVNVTEALGADHAACVDAAAADAQRFAEPEVALDGRMLPHEWIASERGLLKADALDHHADDFLPGSRDIAWDVAGAIVEFDLAPAAADHLVSAYETASGDRGIGRRIGFYETAYLAYRLGYVTMAAESLGDTLDGCAFTQLQARYRRSLAARAARHR
jgi:hypothetical protein